MFICRRSRVAVSALFLLWGAAAAAAQQISLPETLQRFERENAQARALAAGVQIVRAETQARNLLPNPLATYNREDAASSRDVFVLVQQSLPVNGRRGLLRNAGSAQSRAAESESAYELLLLRSDVRTAFYGLLLAQERTTLLEAWVRRLGAMAGILQERQRQGEGSAFDRLRGERELADAQATLASQQVQLARARSQLASFFAPGTDPATLVARGNLSDLAPAPLPPLPELLSRALQARGDYAAVQRQIEGAGFERRAASRLSIPDPLLTAGLKSSTAPGRSGNGYVLSVTVPVPLFNHGQAESNRTRAAEERARAELAARRQQIETGVRATHEAVRLHRRIAEEYARQLGENATELARIAELAYQEGEKGILELLDAQRVAAFSGLQSLDLAWSSKQAEIDLNRSVGEEVLP